MTNEDDEYIDFKPVPKDEEPVEKPISKPSDDDYDFKPKPSSVDVHSQIDSKLLEVRDKIKLMHEIKNDPPPKGEMSVKIPDGTYEVDCNALFNAQIVDCPATVIPMLIDQGVRVALDVKNSYTPKKRQINFNYWWLIVLIIGLAAFYVILSMLGFF